MEEPKEVIVTLKDDEKRVKHDFLIYEDFQVSSEDPQILQCIAEAQKSFSGKPSSVKVQVKLEVLWWKLLEHVISVRIVYTYLKFGWE